MIEPRAASRLVVSALIRRIEAEGGSAAVLESGDTVAGAILLVLASRGVVRGLRERVWHIDGGYELDRAGPSDLEAPAAMADYIARRRKSDPDLWVVELDHPRAEEIASMLF